MRELVTCTPSTTGLALHHPHIITTYTASMYTQSASEMYQIQPLCLASSPTNACGLHGVLRNWQRSRAAGLDVDRPAAGQPQPEVGCFAHIVMEFCPLGSLRDILDGRALMKGAGRGDQCMNWVEVSGGDNAE